MSKGRCGSGMSETTVEVGVGTVMFMGEGEANVSEAGAVSVIAGDGCTPLQPTINTRARR